MPSLADVSLQTGQSLLANDIPEKPQQLTKETSTIQIPASTVCHSLTTQTVDTQHPVESLQTQETIKILKTTDGDHEVIEIATKNVPTAAQEVVQERLDAVPEDIVVDMKYQDPRNADNTTSELNIVHAAPQSFETVLVEPDDVTTEVVVGEDGSKRIIVRKLRKTTVTSRQTTQQHLSTTSAAIGDAPSTVHAFSEATMRDQQVTVTTTKPNGTVETTTKQIYGGRVATGTPYRDVNVEEFESAPRYTHTVTQGQIKDVSPQPLEEGILLEGGEFQAKTSSVHAVVQQVTRRVVRRTRRIIRKVTIIDGKETATEEVIEEPEEVEIDEKNIPHISINVVKQEEKRRFGMDDQVIEEKAQEGLLREDEGKVTKGVRLDQATAEDSPMQGPFFGAFAKDIHPSAVFLISEREGTLADVKKEGVIIEEILSDAEVPKKESPEAPQFVAEDVEKEELSASTREPSPQSRLEPEESVKSDLPLEQKKPTMVDKYEHELFTVEVTGKSLQDASRAFIDAEMSAALQSPIQDVKVQESQEELVRSQIESILSDDVPTVPKPTCKSVDAPVQSETPGIDIEDRTVDVEKHHDTSGTVDADVDVPAVEEKPFIEAVKETPDTPMEKVQKKVQISGEQPVQMEDRSLQEA